MSNQKVSARAAVRWARPTVFASVLMLAGPVTIGRAGVDDICSALTGQKEFVQQSLQAVQGGADKDEVLDTLYCIWMRSAEIEPKVGQGAMEALLHIARDAPIVRRHLLAALETTPEGMQTCAQTVCGLLFYFADERVRKALLDKLKQQWPERLCEVAFRALRDLGDEALLAWVEQVLEDLPANNPRRPMLEVQANFIRAQRTLDGILRFLREEHIGIGDHEVIRQAIRHGATRDDLRAYYFFRIQENDGSPSGRRRCRAFLSNAYRSGVFDKSDIDGLADELRVPVQTKGDLDYGTWPRWATFVSELYTGYWGPSPYFQSGSN